MRSIHHLLPLLLPLLAAGTVLAAGCPTSRTDDDDVSDDDDGVCNDEDADGVCDEDDLCPGGDDSLDLDGDGEPSWCDSTPQRVGEPDDLGGNSSHAVNFLLGSRHTLEEEGILMGVGIIGRRAGSAFKIGIYSDADGDPVALIAEVSGELSSGSRLIRTPALAVPAGDYWMMAVYPRDVSIGEGGGMAVGHTIFIEHEFSDPLPATWPDFDYRVPAPRINIWFDIGR